MEGDIRWLGVRAILGNVDDLVAIEREGSVVMMMRERKYSGEPSSLYPFAPPGLSSSRRHSEPALRAAWSSCMEWCSTWKVPGRGVRGAVLKRRGLGLGVREAVLNAEGFGANASQAFSASYGTPPL